MDPDNTIHHSPFTTHLASLGPFEPSPRIAVALSGGSDSMALTALAERWVKEQGGSLVTLTIDHQLRPDSEYEARQVARWMAHRGIEHHILTPMHTPAGNNMMQAARQWRYRALAEWCRVHGILHCLVAHNQGDQLETAMLHSARGTTEDGAAGMSAIRLYRGVRFLRPLLTTPKSELQAFLRANEIPWIEDPTNAKPELARTQARALLASCDTQEAVALHAEQAHTRMARERAAAEAAIQCLTVHPAGFATLAVKPWKLLEPALRSQLLADAVACVGGHIHRPRQHETAWLESSMAAARGKQTLGNCLIEWNLEEATISREPARCEPPITLKGHGTVLWDQRFRVSYHLEAPLTLGALGVGGRNIINRAVPVSTPALWHLEQLHSVPHIGWSAAESMPSEQVSIGFAPAKPLAASSFWWFTESI